MIHYNISNYEVGDIVKFNTDWRTWRKGDLAKVKDFRFERCNDITSWQLLELEPLVGDIKNDDTFYVYAYCVDIHTDVRIKK